MKRTILVFLLGISLQAMAQGTLRMEVGEFHTIKVFDLIEVNLIQSDHNRIVVKGRNTEDIKWANKDGTLKLRMHLNKRFSGEDTFIEVFYTHLEVIDANEGSRITCNETVQQERISLKAQEGGRIRIGMQVDQAEIRAVTGGIIEASGLAEDQKVVINTGGIFEGRDLRTTNATVKISAGGEAEVFASKRIDIDIKAGGDVIVYGRPEHINKKTFVGGRITMAP